MKKFIMLIIMLLVLPINALAMSTDQAKEFIDSSKNISLSLTYKYDDISINEVTINAYKVADITEDLQYVLTKAFESYPIKLNGIKTNDEWNSVRQTLESYIQADSIKTTSVNIINNNRAKFTNLQAGLYLFITEKIDKETYTLIFDSFLMNLPFLNEDGTWNYNFEAMPKPMSYEPKYEDITYTVIKEWKDNGKTRPESIDIEIYKNNELIENQILSSENNWSYSWLTIDDGSTWNVVERNIPEGYEVTINNQNNKIIIVNTKEEPNPKTGDNIYIYLIMLIISFTGIVLGITSLNKNKD